MKKHVDFYDDEFGMLQLYPEAQMEDNAIEFTLLEAKLDVIRHGYMPLTKVWHLNEQIKAHQIEPGLWCQRPDRKDDPASHDNVTPIVEFSEAYGAEYHEEIKIFKGKFFHPRDIIYYSHLRGKWYDQWTWLFLWVFSLICIESCMSTWKTRNGIKMPVTDGKILTFARCYFKMPITWWICNKIMQRKYKTKYPMHEIFKIYCRHPLHPLIIKTMDLV